MRAKSKWPYQRKIGVDLVDAYAETGLDIEPPAF
jgi:hypothetical protein